MLDRVCDPARPSKTRQAFGRWFKFNLVGAIGIAVQLAALAVSRSLLHFDYRIATALAVETAVLHNFLWHERFTWADRAAHGPKDSTIRFLRFNASNGLVSIAGNLLLMWVLHGELGMNYMAANIAAIAACSLVNFAFSECFVFTARPTSD